MIEVHNKWVYQYCPGKNIQNKKYLHPSKHKTTVRHHSSPDA